MTREGPLERDHDEHARPYREIRAVYDGDTVRVYQAFSRAIAEPALLAQKFVPPFRVEGIVSWIKPSFLWTMARTGWGRYCRIGGGGKRQAEGDTIVLGIDVRREFFVWLLSIAQVTHFEDEPQRDPRAWRAAQDRAAVFVQWDPERNAAGHRLPWRAIQMGLRRHALSRYAAEGVCRIEDQTPRIAACLACDTVTERAGAVPVERPFPVPPEIALRLNMHITRKAPATDGRHDA